MKLQVGDQIRIVYSDGEFRQGYIEDMSLDGSYVWIKNYDGYGKEQLFGIQVGGNSCIKYIQVLEMTFRKE